MLLIGLGFFRLTGPVHKPLHRHAEGIGVEHLDLPRDAVDTIQVGKGARLPQRALARGDPSGNAPRMPGCANSNAPQNSASARRLSSDMSESTRLMLRLARSSRLIKVSM